MPHDKSKSDRISWRRLLTLVVLGSLVGGGVSAVGEPRPAQANHLRGGLITAEYHAPTDTHQAEVHLQSVMLATPSSPDDFGTVNVYRVIDDVPTLQTCTQTMDSKVEDRASNPQFSITTTNKTIRGCFETPGVYIFQATDSARISGILNASGTVQYEVALSIDGVNDSSAPTYNAGYMYNIAYSDDLSYSTNMNGLGQGNSAVTYSLVTNTSAGIGGYGASRIPCSDLNSATGQFRINASLCEGTDTIVDNFGGGTKLYALKVKATDADGQYATRDVLLQFQTTSNQAPGFSSTVPNAGPLSITPGTTQTITVSATDPDDGDTIGFTENLSRAWIDNSASVTTSVVDGVTTYTKVYTLSPPDGTNEVFQFEISAFDDDTFSLSSSVQYDIEAGGVLPPGAPGLPTLSAGAASLTAVFTAPSSGGTVASFRADVTPTAGGATVQNSCDPVPALRCVVTGLQGLTEYSVVIVAVNASGSASSSAATETTLAEPAPTENPTRRPARTEDPVVPPEIIQPPTAPARQGTVIEPPPVVPRVTQGPVLRNGQVPPPPPIPTGFVGGQPQTVQTTLESPSRLRLDLGEINVGIEPSGGQGGVSSESGSTQLSVAQGGSLGLNGQGFRPGTSIQLFLPLEGDNSRELSRLPVGGDGSFDGVAPFGSGITEDPLPIGETLLQLVSVDIDGNPVVMEMTVNIAQGAPAPEFNRTEGTIPALTPGQSLATSAGVPVGVRITTVADQRLLVIEGEDWTMSVNIDSDDSEFQDSPDGPLVRLVRNNTATVSGDGFMSGTRVDVWIFSTPTLLGSFTVDENGSFEVQVNIDPATIEVGQHTLQMQGVGEDGYVKAANLGVEVGDSATTSESPTSTASANFLWWSLLALAILILAVTLVWWRSRRAGLAP